MMMDGDGHDLSSSTGLYDCKAPKILDTLQMMHNRSKETKCVRLTSTNPIQHEDVQISEEIV
jgi:hypothetical protein